MTQEANVSIIAIITTEGDKVTGGSPIFLCSDSNELQEISFKLEKILDAAAHEISPSTMIIVKH